MAYYYNSNAIFGNSAPVTPTVTYATPMAAQGQRPTQSKYAIYRSLLDDPSTDGVIDWNPTSWTSKDAVNNLDLRGQLQGLGAMSKDVKKSMLKYAQLRTNYNNYFNSDGTPKEGVDLNKALKFQRELAKHEGIVSNYANSLRERRFRFDDNGNLSTILEGDPNWSALESSGALFQTAEQANAWKANEGRLNEQKRDWAVKNYSKEAYDQDYYNSLASIKSADDLATLWNVSDSNQRALILKDNGKNGWYGTNANKAEQDYFNSLDAHKKRAYLKMREDLVKNGTLTNYSNSSPKFTGSVSDDDILKELQKDQDYGVARFNKYYGDNGWSDEYDNAHPAANNEAVLKARQIFGTNWNPSFKRGGKMNKYQQGGQAPTAAALVMQALQAAQNGDQSGLQKLFGDQETAKAVIQQLQQEAQQGSQEAVQALEALKQIMGQGQGQAPAMARKGAKLAYIHKLSTGCPEGTELKYFKKGGHICKACVEKAKKAKCGTKAEEGAELEKCGGKAKRKKYFQPGGAVSKKRTTPAPGTKQEADSAATADRLNKGKEVYSEKTGEWIRTSPNGRTIQKTDEDGAGTTTIYIDNKGRKKQYVKPYANGGILLSQLQQTYRNLNKQI